MLDTHRVRTRIEEIRKRITLLENEFKPLSEEKLIADENLYAAAERHLEVAIQACLDIANHLVAALGLERPKQEASESFSFLAKEGIISKELAQVMKSIVGYRNILIHEYLAVERSYTYQNVQRGLGDLVKFAEEIEKYLKKREERN